MVMVFVGGSEVEALVDTGAAVNCIGDQRLVGEKRVQLPKPVRLKGVGSKEAGECVKLSVSVDNENPEDHWFLVIPDNDLFLLGRPLLEAWKAKISMGDGTVTMRGKVFKFPVGNPKEEVDFETVVDVNAAEMKGVKLFEENMEDCGADQLLEKTDLSPQGKETFRAILRKYPAAWKGGFRARAAKVRPHRIPLTSTKAVTCKLRAYPDAMKKTIEAEVKRMLDQGVIQKSSSPYASPPVLVGKPDGTVRFCINYRAINKITQQDRYPLPRIDELLASVKSSKFFISFDLVSGYWQIPMAEEDIPKTAFVTHIGLFEFVVMPFGLTTAPPTFQRAMDELFGDYRHKGILVYLDDLLCHAETEEECLRLAEIVMKRLADVGMCIKPEKSCFGKTKLRYLGHIIGGGVLRPNMAKVQPIYQLTAPRNVPELRRVLGLFGTYRKFIKGYSELTYPLTRLLKKNVGFCWTPQHEMALQQLKEQLGDFTLRVPLDSDELVLQTDASNIACGAVLSVRKGKDLLPVEFASTTLSTTQQNWTTSERECYAIVWAVQKFDGYLRGRRFEVYTDHSCLQWLWKSTVPKLQRWAQRLAEYDMEIFHVSGTKLKHVDALSRDPLDPVMEMNLERMTLGPVFISPSFRTYPSLELIKEEQQKEYEKGLFKDEKTGKWKHGFKFVDGVWRYRDRMYMPETLRLHVLDVTHGQTWSGHPGVAKTCKKIRMLSDWPALEYYVRLYIKSCIVCARSKVLKEDYQGLRNRHPMRALPNEIIGLDFWGPVTVDRNEECLFVTVIDYCTRWAEVIPVRSFESEEVVQVLFNGWFCRFGLPKTIVLDNDSSFKGAVAEIEKVFKVDFHRATPYHPQGNGLIESFHRFLRKAFCQARGLGLSVQEKLSFMMWAYRSLPHEATGETPSFMLMGYDAKMPFEESSQPSLTYADNRERLRLITEVRQFVTEQWEASRVAQQVKMNEGRKEVMFDVGQLVVLRSRPKDAPTKLDKKWSYPFRVTAVQDQGRRATVVSLLDRSVQRDVHIQNVKFVNPPATVQQEVQWEQEQLHEAADLRWRREQARRTLDRVILQSESEFVSRFARQSSKPHWVC